ncbi:selenoprotein [Aspergillus flavus AF70]|nr:selenoprotein [Aspergillus flavus AF70]
MTTPEPQPKTSVATEKVHLPRITIKYCTQCKWMLRAAYFAQELLSTFSTDLGEVALIPATGGIFTVTIYHSSSEVVETQETILWDRKTNGGFPAIA